MLTVSDAISHISYMPLTVNEDWQQHEILFSDRWPVAIHSILYSFWNFSFYLRPLSYSILLHPLHAQFSSIFLYPFPSISCSCIPFASLREMISLSISVSNCKARTNWNLYIYILINASFQLMLMFWCMLDDHIFAIQRRHFLYKRMHTTQYTFLSLYKLELEIEYFLSTSFSSHAPLHNITHKIYCVGVHSSNLKIVK